MKLCGCVGELRPCAQLTSSLTAVNSTLKIMVIPCVDRVKMFVVTFSIFLQDFIMHPCQWRMHLGAGCVGKPANQMMCETVVFGGPVTVTISPCTDMMIRSASWTFNGKTCDIHQKCTKPFSSFQILVSDHLASLSLLSCYLPGAGATLNLKKRHFAAVFFPSLGEKFKADLCFSSNKKTIDWSSAHCNRKVSFWVK